MSRLGCHASTCWRGEETHSHDPDPQLSRLEVAQAARLELFGSSAPPLGPRIECRRPRRSSRRLSAGELYGSFGCQRSQKSGSPRRNAARGEAKGRRRRDGRRGVGRRSRLHTGRGDGEPRRFRMPDFAGGTQRKGEIENIEECPGVCPMPCCFERTQEPRCRAILHQSSCVLAQTAPDPPDGACAPTLCSWRKGCARAIMRTRLAPRPPWLLSPSHHPGA